MGTRERNVLIAIGLMASATVWAAATLNEGRVEAMNAVAKGVTGISYGLHPPDPGTDPPEPGADPPEPNLTATFTPAPALRQTVRVVPPVDPDHPPDPGAPALVEVTLPSAETYGGRLTVRIDPALVDCAAR